MSKSCKNLSKPTNVIISVKILLILSSHPPHTLKMTEKHPYTVQRKKALHVLCILGLLLLGGEINSEKLLSHYFTNLTIDQGLPSNVINSVTEDKHGFIWIGTEDGLCRYDGYEMQTFRKSGNGEGLPSDNISCLLYDDDHIWVGTWDGLCTINTRTFEIQQINTGRSKAIRALYKDHSGHIWIGTGHGLLKYDQKEDTYNFFDVTRSGLSHNTIRSIHETPDHDLWIGTYDGLNLLRNGEIETFDLKKGYKPMLDNNLILSIENHPRAKDSLLWVGTETGLVRFNKETGHFKHYHAGNTQFSNEVIKSIHVQNDSLLWLGTDFGLNIFNIHTGEVQHHFHDPLINNTIANNVIAKIFEDTQQHIWLVTSGGLSIVDKGTSYYQMHEAFFSPNEPRIGNQIRDVTMDREGNLWMATIHGVIKENINTRQRRYFSTTTPEKERRLLLDNVYAVQEGEEDRIWIGTAGGINIWDKKSQKMHAITAGDNNGLTSNYISGITQDAEGTIWISAWEGGIFRMNSSQNLQHSENFTLINNDGDASLIFHGNKLFYASGSGFYEIDRKTLEQKPVMEINKATKNKNITALMSGQNNHIWIAAGNQVFAYQPGNGIIKQLSFKINTPQKIINLAQDQQRNVWATTKNIIIRKNIQNNEIINIPVNPASPFKGFYAGCGTLSQNGHIFFGGDNAYVEITPEKVNIPQQKPEVYISGLRVNNQSKTPNNNPELLKSDIAFQKKIDLRHNQNSLTFEFSTLDYLYPDHGKFRCRLTPDQEEWIYSPGKNNFAVFANIKPGTYTFEVQGTNHLGIWSEPLSVKIHISPSIWLSKGFLALYALLAVSLTYFIFRIYNYRQGLRNELNIVRLEKQHSDALYQAKIRFFTNISHEFRTPLGLIITPLKQLARTGVENPKMDRMIRLANRNAERLYKLINQLLDFRKIESSQLHVNDQNTELIAFCKDILASFEEMANRHQINYEFHTNEEKINCSVDREKVETIIFNLLSNAFKYTPEGGAITVNLSIISEDDQQPQIKLSVSDTGPGIPEDKKNHIFELFYRSTDDTMVTGSGIGLTLAMEYAKLHDGTIETESTTDKGSTFTLLLPLIEKPEDNQEKSIQEKPSSEVSRSDRSFSHNRSTPTLLLADDQPDSLEYLATELEDTYNLIMAEDGECALNKIRENLPDMVISDVMMPVMDGMELCEHIKTTPSTAHIPVILLTAKTLDIDKTEGMNKGADLYITKPFDMPYLRSAIEGIFRRNEQMKNYIKQKLILNPATDTDHINPEEEFLGKIMTIIERNLDNSELSVEMISKNLGMSSTHLYRRLKAITDQSPRQIIINYRMQKAAQMLENKQGNISEIMMAVGFSSLSSFSKSFKAKFGVSPREYGNQQTN